MKSDKKLPLIFLLIISVINIAAGIASQIEIIKDDGFTSVIPTPSRLTDNQVILLNFTCLAVIIFLINIVTLYLTCDVPYSPGEIIANCPTAFMLLPAVVLVMGIYNTICADLASDRVWIMLYSIIYFLLCGVNFACIITIKEDFEE